MQVKMGVVKGNRYLRCYPLVLVRRRSNHSALAAGNLGIEGAMLCVRQGQMIGLLVLLRSSRPNSQEDVMEARAKEEVVEMALTISGRREVT